MTSSESEYSLGDEEMEAADELMTEDQLESRSQSDVDTEDHTDLVSLVKYQPFPKHITQVLESFYTRGMRGWGKKHASAIDAAAGATGLAQSQIEVSIILTRAL